MPLATVITISDSVARGEREDASGAECLSALRNLGFSVAPAVVVPDDAQKITLALREAVVASRLVVTTGGTGFSPRDVTPEATKAVLEREAPGIAELLRAHGARSTPRAALSRGVAGLVASCLVINLPGSPKAVREGMEALSTLLPHAVDILEGRTRHS